nr:hypothetical protein HmN_000843900 [Hymenolepis microstoma]
MAHPLAALTHETSGSPVAMDCKISLSKGLDHPALPKDPPPPVFPKSFKRYSQLAGSETAIKAISILD